MQLISACICLFLFLPHAGLNAQDCEEPSALSRMQGNQIVATLRNDGGLFWGRPGDGFFPQLFSTQSDVGSMGGVGLWFMGLDSAQHFNASITTYLSSDYRPGPLSPQGETTPANCKNWNRFFFVSGDDIAGFLQNLDTLRANPQQALSLYPEIMGWPGRGNPFFSTLNNFDLPDQDLAPFIDADADNNYNPLAGDYPVVRVDGGSAFAPARFAWWVYNDVGTGAEHALGGGSLSLEVQQQAWAFNCTDNPLINKTLFVSYNWLPKGSRSTDSTFIGLWMDPELGCPADDYIGCDPFRNTVYFYNEDAVDGTDSTLCSPASVGSFGYDPPIQSVTFLNRPLRKFMVMYGGTGLPAPVPPAMTTPIGLPEHYNYMNGLWRDGSSLKEGENGYAPNDPDAVEADFAFPGNPQNLNAWSMCTAGAKLPNARVIASLYVGKTQSGKNESMVTAWTTHSGPGMACNLHNLYAEVDEVQRLFNASFVTVCSPAISTRQPDGLPIDAFPNPADDVITVQYGNAPTPQAVCLYTVNGRLVYREEQPSPGSFALQVGHLPAGLYVVKLVWNHRVGTKMIYIIR